MVIHEKHPNVLQYKESKHNIFFALYACIYRNAANWFPDMQKRDMFLYKHNIFLWKEN